MAITHTTINFYRDEPEDVLSRMEGLDEARNGKSWMNLFPWVEANNYPRTSLILKFFSAKGPEIPQATWVPPSLESPGNLGFSHSAGRNAVLQLEDLGVMAPSEWRLIQDHTKRGLVFEMPSYCEVDIILDFMIQASANLSGVMTDTRWVADFLEQKSRRER